AKRRFCVFPGSVFIVILCIGVQSQSAPSSPQQPSPQRQTTAQPQPQTAYESATVLKTVTRMVVIDVVATDHKDHLVPDLSAADFTVLEDGQEQEIKIFSFQHPTPAPAAPAAQKPSEQTANIFT